MGSVREADECSGYAAFLDPDVNRMLKKVLNYWGRYLQVCHLCKKTGELN
jgi:phosphatidylserine decarboxylase